MTVQNYFEKAKLVVKEMTDYVVIDDEGPDKIWSQKISV